MLFISNSAIGVEDLGTDAEVTVVDESRAAFIDDDIDDGGDGIVLSVICVTVVLDAVTVDGDGDGVIVTDSGLFGTKGDGERDLMTPKSLKETTFSSSSAIDAR